MQQQFHWFLDPIKDHYVDFEGRVTRQTFWMFTLWSFGLSILLGIASDMIANIFSLAILLPSIGLGARRLHDIGMSGWWQLLSFIPVIGWIVLIYFLAKQGETGPNMYGVDPRAVTVVSDVPVTAAATDVVTPALQVQQTTPPTSDDEVK